jgi:hypothetical protein
MEFLHWLRENWFDLFQTAAIVGGFVAIHRDKTKERVQNRIHFTERHAELSRQQHLDPRLARLQRMDIDLTKAPLTKHEEYHVQEQIHHLAATHFAAKNGVFTLASALPEDIRSYFQLPIPLAVWKKAKRFHEPDFVEFVESHIDTTL